MATHWLENPCWDGVKHVVFLLVVLGSNRFLGKWHMVASCHFIGGLAVHIPVNSSIAPGR